MVNILFIINGAKPPRGGEYHTLYLIQNIDRNLFNPIVAYAAKGAIITALDGSGITTVHLPLDEKLLHTYPRVSGLFKAATVLRLFRQIFFSFAILRIVSLVKKRDISVIYCADNLSKLLGGIAAKFTKAKTVAHCHDQFKEDILGKTMRLFYALLLDRIIAVSYKVKDFFRNTSAFDRVRVVYNGVDADYFHPDKGNKSDTTFIRAEDDVVLLSVGVLEPDKGHIYLLQAVKRLCDSGLNNIRCVICGEGQEKDRLAVYVRDNGLVDRVLFLGFCDNLRDIYCRANILVMTSLTIESFSLVTAEAMACALPVVATNTGGLPEVVGDTGIIVDPGDVDALCKALDKLIHDQSLRRSMGQAARKRVEDNFTLAKSIRDSEKVFMELVQG